MLRFSLILLLLSAGGCSVWHEGRWDMSQLRDPRAADIDKRLTAQPQAVANPFGKAEQDNP